MTMKCCRCGGRASNGIEVENTETGAVEEMVCCDPCLPAVIASLARDHGRSDEEEQWDALHHTGALRDRN